jgi:hypothetical protein
LILIFGDGKAGQSAARCITRRVGKGDGEVSSPRSKAPIRDACGEPARLVTLHGRTYMSHLKCLADALVFACLLLFASTQGVHAYIDPGTGSYVIQILIAALAGAAFAVKIYWRKIKGIFSRSSPESQAPESDEQ